MVKDAEAHAAEDKKRRELVEARNQADGLIHTDREAASKEHGDKVRPADKTAIEAAIAELREALKDGDDADASRPRPRPWRRPR